MPRPAVLIGRFQPPHRAHLALMQQALDTADELVIVLGSAHSARTIRNPLLSAERGALITEMLRAEGGDPNRIRFEAVPDVLYNLPLWVNLVRQSVGGGEAWLAGFEKDASSFYLRLFPGWQALVPEVALDISATVIRQALFRRDWARIGRDVTPAVLAGLMAFARTDAFTELLADQAATERLKNNHPVRTAAALLVSGDQMLLMPRRESPGLGLWSLPEARSVQEALQLVLDADPGDLQPLRSRLLDAPQRVPDLDWQTRATLFRLTSPLPARPDARWLPLALTQTHAEAFFADHAQAVRALLEDWPGNED